MKIKKLFSRYFSYILNRPVVRNLVPEKYFIKYRYYFYNERKLNLKNPVFYNEKLQWLKLYAKNPEYSKLVDKFEVRKYVSNLVGEKYLIPLLSGPFSDFKEINIDDLPEQFVIKTTHDSGGVLICQNKKKFDFLKAELFVREHQQNGFYWLGREFPYKGLSPRIIVEKYMVDESGYELKDYKIFCFNGVPKIIQVDFGRFNIHKRNFYDTNWTFLDFSTNVHVNDKTFMTNPPATLSEMIKIAKTLSKNIPHVRVDLYSINNSVYFGELTFFHGSGFEKFSSDYWEKRMGDWLILPKKNV